MTNISMQLWLKIQFAAQFILEKKLLTQVYNDVRVEPTFPSLTGENFTSSSTNVVDDACLDISTRGFWTKHQMEFLMIKVLLTQTPIGTRTKAFHNAT